jgi:Domain of unknown function (DUF3597)
MTGDPVLHHFPVGLVAIRHQLVGKLDLGPAIRAMWHLLTVRRWQDILRDLETSSRIPSARGQSRTRRKIMSIFGSIASAIFGHGSAPGTTPIVGSAAASAAKGTVRAPGAVVTPMTREQVEDMIEKLADAQDEEYNWERSIVDLMKLLKLDSSLTARKQLAQELGYTERLNGSAEMNIWLHRQVMTKLAESGGVVPDSLKHA